ncbi:MAG: hypothetical protein NVSMB26_09900 [Beijerinckiaceae bacterium]
MKTLLTIAACTAVAAAATLPLPASAQGYYYDDAPIVAGPPAYYPYYPYASAEPRPYYRNTGQPDPYLSGTRGRMNQGASPIYPEGSGNPRTR